MSEKRPQQKLQPGTKVRLTGDFVNGQQQVLAKAGAVGVVVKRAERGTEVCAVQFGEVAFPIFPKLIHLEVVEE